jgi:hypothetical protein
MGEVVRDSMGIVLRLLLVCMPHAHYARGLFRFFPADVGKNMVIDMYLT